MSCIPSVRFIDFSPCWICCSAGCGRPPGTHSSRKAHQQARTVIGRPPEQHSFRSSRAAEAAAAAAATAHWQPAGARQLDRQQPF
eukprot:1158509-Pelagomonas_calceolata.AAC.5